MRARVRVYNRARAYTRDYKVIKKQYKEKIAFKKF